MLPASTRPWSLLAICLLLGVFLLDLTTPPGVAAAVLYALAIMAAIPTQRARLVIPLAAIAATLALADFWISWPPPVGTQPRLLIGNALISLLAIAIAAILALVMIERGRRLVRVQDELDEHQRLVEMAGRVGRFGAWSLDKQTRRVKWTEQVARIHEVEPGQSQPLESAIGFYAPEYREEVRVRLDHCLNEGVPFDEEWQLVTATGRRIWVRAIGEPMFDDQGRICGAEGAFQDIDAQKRAEESARISRKRFRQLADAMPLFVWTTTAEGRMDYLNRYGLEYVDAPLEDVEGDKWVQRIHPDDRGKTIDRWLHCVRTGTPYATEFRLLRGDGDYRWHQVSATPVRSAEGKVDRWFGVCIDIQEQRRLADRLVRTLESITDIFYAFDHEWRFIYINARGEELAGRKREEILGTVIWESFPEALDTRFYREYTKAVETGQPSRFVEYYEPFDVWLDVTAYPTEEGLAVYLRDITVQRRAEQQLRQAQRLESIGQLTGGVAHDFNNLLTVVLGNSELIGEVADDHPAIREAAELITRAAERGAELTRRLLAFARRQPLEPEAVDVNLLIRDMSTLLHRTLGGHIEIQVEADANLWPAMVDPGQLDDALLNLCLNARDAMPDGGRLEIRTFNAHTGPDEPVDSNESEANEYVVIAVSDSGRGIAPENLDRVFEPFFTSGKSGKGTGLGLPMVYGFVKQSGGHVEIESEVDQGTTVCMYLPRSEQAAAARQKVVAQPVGGHETVLLVEDEPLVRQVTATELERLGYKVLEAGSGREAMEIIESDAKIDLLFTDLVMPGGLTGRQLADQALQMRPDLRVLYTSGYAEDAMTRQGRLDPGILLLRKPHRHAELAAAVRRALDESSSST